MKINSLNCNNRISIKGNLPVQKSQPALFNSFIMPSSLPNTNQQHTIPKQPKKINYPVILGSLVGVAAIAACIIHSPGAGKIKPLSFTANTRLFDVDYKQKLIEGLKNTFNLDCKIEDLQSIVGKDEFKSIVPKYKPQHFVKHEHAFDFLKRIDTKANLGGELPMKMKVYENFLKNLAPNDLETYYKPLIDGSYRIQLQNYSNYNLPPLEAAQQFLDNTVKYADKVAKTTKDKSVPPFLVSLTDFLDVDVSQNAIYLMAKNP